MKILIANVMVSTAQTPYILEFFNMRRRVFVEQMQWNLMGHEEMEFEQYDNLGRTWYVLSIEDGKVTGGARLLRCDTSFGSGNRQYSYMIRDAYLGLIDLPRSLCTEPPPVDPQSWELTRFVVDKAHPKAGREILDAANDFLYGQGAAQCLFLGSPAFMRMARLYGYQPTPLGPICGNKDGRFVAFSCPCVAPATVRSHAVAM